MNTEIANRPNQVCAYGRVHKNLIHIPGHILLYITISPKFFFLLLFHFIFLLHLMTCVIKSMAFIQRYIHYLPHK